ncbi:hypothetical protein C8R43DRAFT_1230632 [Mycena crocata]|nr:hypothetical protein C8R43DRAFT_1230632 [Mycena crocata]
MLAFLLRLLVLSAVTTTYVSAAPATPVTVILPFSHPISTQIPAEVLGVDAQGRTTYAVEVDQIDRTTTKPATATFVEGAGRMGYTVSQTVGSETVVFGIDCELHDGSAICSDVDSKGQVETATFSGANLQTAVLAVTATASKNGPASSNVPNSSERRAISVFGAVSGVVVGAYLLL